MARSALHRSSISPRLVAALGAVCALAIAVAASVDLGRPLEAARAEAEREAANRGAAVELAWERIASRELPPGPPLGVQAKSSVKAPELRMAPRSAPVELAPDVAFDLRLDSALLATRPEQYEDALALIEEALAQNPNAPRAAEARLAGARFASSRNNVEAVERHRAALLAPDAPTGTALGTTLALLACLVHPIDVESASELLRKGALPPPSDRVAVRADALEFVSDPWWSAIEERLRAADPSADLASLFQHDDRRAHASAAFASRAEFKGAEETWTLVPFEGATLAVRRGDDGVDVLAVDERSVARALETELRNAFESPWHLDFDGRRANGETLFGPEELARTGLTYRVVHDDPESRGRDELARGRLLRTGLFGLSILVLATALLAARALARARRLAELRSTFVASVSHDLRTPTQAILLLAETLEQDRLAPPTPENRARYHGRIRKEAERLRRLVEDLLDSARIDRGEGARIERRDVDLEPFFGDIERAMEERANSLGAELTVVRSSLPQAASIDPDGVRRAIWNLYENALAHGAREDGTARVEVTIEADSDRLVVTVGDDGPGIPARLREAAFSPFERLRDRKAATGDIATDTGTGLGLAIVRSLAKAHGGDAAFIDSDQGARVSASFALEQAPKRGSAA